MNKFASAAVGIERFFAEASSVFAVLATALAALGLYSVLAYSVAQRSREIGLRARSARRQGASAGLCCDRWRVSR